MHEKGLRNRDHLHPPSTIACLKPGAPWPGSFWGITPARERATLTDYTRVSMSAVTGLFSNRESHLLSHIACFRPDGPKAGYLTG